MHVLKHAQLPRNCIFVTKYSNFRMRKALCFFEVYSSQYKSTDSVPSTYKQQQTPSLSPHTAFSAFHLHHLALPMISSAHWRHCPSLIRHLSSEICLCWIIFHEHRGCLFRSSLRDHAHQREVKQTKGVSQASDDEAD